MVSRLRLNPRAKADLEDIFLYTVDHWSLAQADRYIIDIEDCMRMLSDTPELGRAIEDVRAGYFKYLIRSHLIVYRRHVAGIEIMRILHQRMDLKRHI